MVGAGGGTAYVFRKGLFALKKRSTKRLFGLSNGGRSLRRGGEGVFRVSDDIRTYWKGIDHRLLKVACFSRGLGPGRLRREKDP